MVKPHPFEKLPSQLWEVSQQAGRRAVLHYRDEDVFERVQAAVNLGLAAEVLLMAAVAQIDTVFLADGSSPASKIALSRGGNPTGVLIAGDIRTIGWDDARRLLLVQDGKLLALAEPLRQVMNTRNAAAHAGLTDAGALGDAVINLVTIVDLLHGRLEWSSEEYWGDQIAPMIEEVLDKKTNEVRQAKTAKVINAVKAFDSVRSRLTPAALDAYVEIAQERAVPTFAESAGYALDKVLELECPSCGYQGHIVYSGEDDGEVETLYHDLMDEDYFRVYVYWWPVGFECPVCNLRLNSAEAELLPGAIIDAKLEDFMPGDAHFEYIAIRSKDEPDYFTMDEPSSD